MRSLLIIVAILLIVDIGVNADQYWQRANAENVYYGCVDCHNAGTFKKFWSHLGSERLHLKHETLKTDCLFCHRYEQNKIIINIYQPEVTP